MNWRGGQWGGGVGSVEKVAAARGERAACARAERGIPNASTATVNAQIKNRISVTITP